MKAWKPLLVLGIAGAVAGFALAHDDDTHTRSHGKAQIITIGEDGEPHSRSWVFDDDGHGGYLGVSLTEGRRNGGARIVAVMDDSPAAEAGLREDDVIIAVDGDEVRRPGDLTRLIRRAEPGDEIELEVRRGDRERSIVVELGERPSSFAFAFGSDSDFSSGFSFNLEGLEGQMEGLMERLEGMNLDLPFGNFHGSAGSRLFSFHSDRPRLGIQVIQPTAELREFMGGPGDAGIIVGKVLPDTPAEEAGVAVGDLILAVDGDEIRNIGDLLRALGRSSGELTLELVRNGRTVTLDVILPENERDEDPGPTRRMRLPMAPKAPAQKA